MLTGPTRIRFQLPFIVTCPTIWLLFRSLKKAVSCRICGSNNYIELMPTTRSRVHVIYIRLTAEVRATVASFVRWLMRTSSTVIPYIPRLSPVTGVYSGVTTHLNNTVSPPVFVKYIRNEHRTKCSLDDRQSSDPSISPRLLHLQAEAGTDQRQVSGRNGGGKENPGHRALASETRCAGKSSRVLCNNDTDYVEEMLGENVGTSTPRCYSQQASLTVVGTVRPSENKH